MPSIENRIVQMQFDNSSFERRMEETLKSLQKLNDSLANAGSKNGLEQLDKSVKGFNLDPIATSIEGISTKFLAMSTIAITVLSKVAGAAIDAGAKILSSLSLDPIIDGFQEYSTQIGSIQTILSNTDSKGTTLDQVNSALDQLNQYSDKTIYNFGEMTRNIGTFTAAGVDLDTSVQSIKGIANLAAISGSNSQQASTAMYQLSQAIATGSVKLMDWNSVVNAGMGGEVFQKALFDTGVAMGSIADVPMGTSFEDWTAAGNTFRTSLESGWLSADVLTATLSQFTGELTKDQILAQGFTDEQADAILRLGQLGVDAATKVRTLKGLIDTTKEALGSGWAQSFRIIFGDFNEATELFTNISNMLGGIIGKSAETRNALLQGWSDLGGRTVLIEAMTRGFAALSEILRPIKEAFRDIFPPLTAQRLFDLTVAANNLFEALRPGEQTMANIKRIFTGFFGALEIGWTILKETAKFIGGLFASATGAGSGKFLDFAAKIGDFFTSLNDKLVTQGGIKRFFEELPGKIAPIIDKLIEFRDKAVELFSTFVDKAGPVVDVVKKIADGFGDFFSSLGGGAIDVAADATNRLGQRFQTLKDILEKIGDLWEPFKTALGKVADALDQTWEVIRNWFAELGTKLKAVFGPGDFDSVVDAVNVGLLGGIAAILAKFLKNGLKLDVGNGLFDGITKSFEQLTGIMKAMQTDIKADALLKIAGAIGILTASVLVLSLIDSAALTKSLTAMAVGFGQLVGAFAILNTIASGPRSAASMAIIATGLILLSGAMLVMAVAVRILAGLSWEELGKGLAAILILLGGLTLIAGPLGNSSGGMIRAGIGISALAIGLNILAGAVKLFSMFSWSDMLRGFAGVAAGLLIIAGAMQLMPATLPLTGAGLILVAIGMNILAGALKLFSGFDWGEMGKGLVAMAGSLFIIAAGLSNMPPTMPLIGAGLILVGAGLIVISKALREFATFDWGDMVKGLVGMAASLTILAVATMAMSGSIVGAISIGVVAASLMLLVRVIGEFAKIKVGDLVKGLLGIAAVFALLGGAALLLSPVTPALLGLGAALLLIGAGFALFGLGANLFATAIQKVAAIGEEGLGVLLQVMDAIIIRIPDMVKAFAEGLIELAQVFIDAAPVLIDGLGVVLEHLITTIITLLPKLGELIGGIIQQIINVLREKIPEYIQLGIDILLALLTGIRDNIAQVVTLALEIIGQFLVGITNGIPQLVTAAANLITTFIDSIASHLGEIIASGVGLLVSFIDGITDNLAKVVDAVGRLVAEFISAVAGLYGDIITAGVDALIQFLSGITNNLVKVVTAVGEMITEFISAVGNQASAVARAGTDALVNFLQGISNSIYIVGISAASVIIRFIQTIGSMAGAILVAGVQVIISFVNGLYSVVSWLVTAAFQLIIAFVNGLANAINTYAPQLRSAGLNLAGALVDGATFGLASKAKSLADKAVGIFKGAVGAVGGFLGIGGPSKLFCEIGKAMIDGAAGGIEDNDSMERATLVKFEDMTATVQNALDKFTVSMGDMSEMNPVITPVLDLTQVTKDAKSISTLIPSVSMAPEVSYATAQSIASTQTGSSSDASETNAADTGGIRFEQNIYSPAALSTGDIYKQTRTQLTMAKEELNIP